MSSSSPLRGESNSLKFGSFNVRGLVSKLKKENLISDMKRYELDFLCLQETKIKNLNELTFNGYRMIFLPSSCIHYGNGFVISPRLSDKILTFGKISDRIGFIKMRIQMKVMTFICVYGPTLERVKQDTNEVDNFYYDLSHFINSLSPSEIYFVMGDFNSKLGRKRDSEQFMGSFGRGFRNFNGHQLADFAQSYNLFACNTAFRKAAKHRTTWIGYRKNVRIYNQIDFIFCQERYKSLCKNSQSFGGTITDSDHKLVWANFDFRRLFGLWGKIQRVSSKNRPSKRFNTFELSSDIELQLSYKYALRDHLAELDHPPSSFEEMNDIIVKVASNVVGVSETKNFTIKSCPQVETGGGFDRNTVQNCK
jgi:exonuclease III